MNLDFIISWSVDRTLVFLFGMILTFVWSVFKPIEFSFYAKKWNRRIFHRSKVKIEYSFSTKFKVPLSNLEFSEWIQKVKKDRNFSSKSEAGVLFKLSLINVPNILFEVCGLESESGDEIEGGSIRVSYVGVPKETRKQITEIYSTSLTLLARLSEIEPARLSYSEGSVIVHLDRAPMAQYFIDQFEIEETRATSKKHYSIDIEEKSLRFSGNLNNSDIIDEIARVSDLA